MQEWCFLVCSSGLPSDPVAWSAGCARRVAARAVRTWKSGLLDLLPRMFQSLLWCLGVACGVLDFSGDLACSLVRQWIHVLREALDEFSLIFYVAVNSNPQAFYLHSRRMDGSLWHFWAAQCSWRTMKSSSSSRAPCKLVSVTCSVGHLWSYTSRTLTVSETTTTSCRVPLFASPVANGLQRAAQFRSCTATSAATAPLMAET